jgi:peptidoglycan lytic transglycosylase
VRATARGVALAGILPALALAAGCAGVRARAPRPPQVGAIERGVASWYGPPFHGRRTANGERYDMHQLTAAHRTLPFDTLVEVRNLDNGRAVRVRINDRGPHVKRRIIDLSRAAADEVGMLGPGTAQVEVVVLGRAAAPDGFYTVQVGAFGEAERARALCDELRGRYPEATVADDGAWHRVRLGEFPFRGDAERLQAELAGLGFPALIIRLDS